MKIYSLITILLLFVSFAQAQQETMYIYKIGDEIQNISTAEIDSITITVGETNYLKIHKSGQVIDVATNDIDSIIFYEIIPGNIYYWEINQAVLGDEMVSFRVFSLNVEGTVNENEWIQGTNDFSSNSSLVNLPLTYFEENENIVKFRVNIDGNIGEEAQQIIYKGSYIYESEDSTNINISSYSEGSIAKDIIVQVNNSMVVADPEDDVSYLILPDNEGNIAVSNLPSSSGIGVYSENYEKFTLGLSPIGSLGQTYNFTVNTLPIVEGTKLTGTFLKRTGQGDVPFEESDGDVWMHLHREGVATEELFVRDDLYNTSTGEFEISRLAGGQYINSLFWPSAHLFLSPGPYNITPGETSTINFVLDARVGTISGTVTALDGVTPIANCNINMQKEINMGGVITEYNTETFSTDEEGNYSIETFYGNYNLNANTNGGASFNANNIEISGDTLTFNFQIDTSTTVPTTNGVNFNSAVSTNYFTGLSNPAGMDIDSSGNIYVAEYGANQIVKIDNATQEKTVIVSDIEKPVGLTFYNNYLYCATNIGKVIKVDLSDNTYTEIASIDNKKLGDIEIFNETEIYVSEFDMNSPLDNGGGQEVYIIDVQTGNIDYTYQLSGLGVYGLKHIKTNKLLVAQLSGCTLIEIDTTSNIISNLNTQIIAQLGDIIKAPNGMVISTEIIIGDNNLGNEIIFIDPTTRAAVSYFLDEDCKPFGIVINDNDLYVSELKTGKITKITGIVFNSLE